MATSTGTRSMNLIPQSSRTNAIPWGDAVPSSAEGDPCTHVTDHTTPRPLAANGTT